jgi:hypothetical protein
MPLYLVRWPDLSATIVRADDEDHLTDLLDQVASPTDAAWMEYDGPLWIDIEIGIKANPKNGDWELEDENVARQPWFGAEVRRGECDDADDMLETVFDTAFPHLAKLLEVVADPDDEAPFDAAEAQKAALMDLRLHEGSGELPASLRKMLARRKRH